MPKLTLDVSSIVDEMKAFSKEMADDCRSAVENLATLTRAQIVIKVQQEEKDNKDSSKGKLNSRRHIYMENLSDAKQSSFGVWVISLDEPALFIEDGMKAHDMKPDLLKGAKRRVIPFRYNTIPTRTAPSTQLLISQIQSKLKSKKIPYSTLETDKNGKPLIGRLHTLKWGVSLKGGNAIPGRGNTPILKGLAIYQKHDEKTGNVRRDILTFRTVMSEGQEGKWLHPGLAAKKYMDRSFEEAVREWENKILPEMETKWSKK